MKILKILTGSILIISLCTALQAQERDLRPYRLVNADMLYIDRVEDEYLTRLNGNVHFFYGETEFFSDMAEIYEVQRIARLFGNVKVVEDSLTLHADHAEYRRLEEHLILTGNVFIREEHEDGTERTFSSTKAQYLRNDRRIYAFENIYFHDERENVNGYSNYLDYDLSDGYGFITDNPEIEVVGEQNLNIVAERMEFYRDFNRIAASFGVNTVYEEYLITSDFLLYFMDDEYAVYLGEPALTADIADATADQFYIYFEDRKIKSATLEDNCVTLFAVKEGDEKNSRIECSLMELFFRDGKISEMHAFDNVKSLYVSETTDRDTFMNYAESEQLIITINSENEIETIVFQGQVRGQYHFSDKIIDNEED